MTYEEARRWLRGKRAAFLLRESSIPQMEMTGPLGQKRSHGQATNKWGLIATQLLYSFAHSGTDIFSNPIAHQIIADARAKKFDVLVIAYASRFSRDLHDAMVLLHTLVAAGVPVYFVKEDTLAGFEERWMRKVGRELLSAHEFSDDFSQERCDTNMTNWVERGIANGRPAFGYRWTDTHPARIVKDDRAVCGKPAWEWTRFCFERYLTKKVTLADIARELNAASLRSLSGKLFSGQSVRSILKNPIATGWLRFHVGRADEDKKYREDLRLITDGEFNRTQAIMRKRRESHLHPARVKYTYIFKDIARCGGCGSHYWGKAFNLGGVVTAIALTHPRPSIDDQHCPLRYATHSERKLEVQVGSGCIVSRFRRTR